MTVTSWVLRSSITAGNVRSVCSNPRDRQIMSNRISGRVSPSPVPSYDAAEEKYQKEMKDLEPFNAMGIMNEGLSVLPDDGNRTLKAITEKVAPIISKEDV